MTSVEDMSTDDTGATARSPGDSAKTTTVALSEERDAPLMSVSGLKKYFYEQDTLLDRLLGSEPVAVRAVDGVSFDVYEGETLGLVGESGCGKSTTGETVLGLQESTGGTVEFDGQDVFELIEDEGSGVTSPPLGVKLLCGLVALAAVAVLVAGGFLAVTGPALPTQAIGAALVVTALVNAAIVYGLWKVEPWGWRLAVGFYVFAAGVSLTQVPFVGLEAALGVVGPLAVVAYLALTREVYVQPPEFRRHAQVVFQDPFSSLDPRMTVEEIVRQPLDVHDVGTAEERRARIEELLERVGMSADHLERYPNEFSGGQRQRIGIARALALDPDFLVLDEPTSALDVSVQAQIINLLDDLQDEFGLTYLLISHDLSVIRHICDRVAVMYLGELVEVGPADEVFESPRHPYTKALLESVPRATVEERDREVETLSGDVPSPRDPPSGCRFRTRCPEIIPPEDCSLDQIQYRAVMDLRERIEREEISLEAVRGESSEENGDLTEELADRLLEAELPEAHEAYVQEALNAVADERFEAAADHLRERYESVCELENPPLGTGGHPAACHLLDD